MVIANPTTTPLRVPTRVSSAVQHTETSGELVQAPTDGRIGCLWNRDSETVISDASIDTAAFVRFAVPEVRQWSIGFVYHDIGGNSDSATFIWSEGPDTTFARYRARRDGQIERDPPSERISASVLRPGLNELSFRTTSDGSFLRLNEETVIEVPASLLIRRNGRSQLCVGFHSVKMNRTRFSILTCGLSSSREGASGLLINGGP